MLACLAFASGSTESVIANGETRTISFSNGHTNEAGSFTYMVNGTYDSSVLDKLNWFLRDWRHDEKIAMDPKLFDVIWEVYRESGSSEPIDVLSAYRSPETNAMLRRRSRQVAEHSQHMMGRAIDAHFIDVPTSKIRDIAMRLQAGGVGFYPTGNTPWVHIDSGSVRYWPRMSHDQIARLFPDGKTVFVPSDGVPLPGYQQAAAEIQARGGAVYGTSGGPGGSNNLLAMLFGGGEDDEEENGQAPGRGGRGGASARTIFAAQNQIASAQPDANATVRHDTTRVDTFLRSPDAATTAGIVASSQSQKLEALAVVEQPDAGAANVLDAAPLPPRRPSELALLEAGLSDAPTPPARPIEFAAVSGASPAVLTGPATVDSAPGNGLVTALLAHKLPNVITRGASGAAPSGALALAEFEADAPERPVALARAAALASPLPAIDWTKLSPLARAALLSAPLSPAHAAPKGVLVAARIDRSNFTVMTAAPTKAPGKVALRPRMVAVMASARPDALMAMLTPNAQAPVAFAAQPYGDLRSDAFTGPAVKPLGGPIAPGDSMTLRGSAD